MRVARAIAPGAAYHIISRFVDRDWELRGEAERTNYLRLLGRALERSDWRCLSYALMSSHIHLAMIAGKQPMWRWLKRVHSPFGNWMNKQHGRLGPLFAHRPSAWGVRPEHVPDLIAYIHNNPVRAGVVAQARDSSWTSHAGYVGRVPAAPWLEIEEGLRRCDRTPESFDAFVDGCESEPERVPLVGVQRSARKYGGVEIATPVGDPTTVPLVARSFARIRPDPRVVLSVLARVIDIPAARIASRSNRAEVRRARCHAIHSAQLLGLTISEMSAALGISRQAGSKIAARELDELGRAVITLVASTLTELTPSPPKAAQVQDQMPARR